MKNISKYCLFLSFLLPLACQEDELELGTPVESSFQVVPVEGDPNRMKLIANSSNGPSIKKWDLGNGSTLEGDTVVAYFPFEGEYNVTLTAYSRGGTANSDLKVSIPETDPKICEDQVLELLTGGCEKPEGKTWVIDASTKGHFGLGPNAATGPDWYAANPNEKAGGGLYDDQYTFKLINYRAEFQTNGDVFIRADQASNFSESYPNLGDVTATYDAPENLSYVVEMVGGKTFLKINAGGFIGYFTGVTRYEILTLEENLLFLKYFDAKEPAFAWFLRLIPEGVTPPPPPPPATSTFPITFEGELVSPFNGFGGSTYEVVDNPASAGINTSAKVGKYVKGTEGNWAGIETTLDAKLDFSTNTLIKYKVYSPVTGRALFKLESVDQSATPIEVFAEVTQVNEWQELTFDFSEAASGTYDKIAMFLDFDNNAGGTFYIDDIRQAATAANAVALPLTFETKEPAYEAFGGSTLEYVNNPSKMGLNTSNRVVKTVHGNESWAGMFFNLTDPLTIVAGNKISIKVWAPKTGTFRLKLENIANTQDFVEVDAAVTQAEQWVELLFDIPVSASGKYARVVVFPGWTTTTADTYYFDDIALK